MAPMSNQLDDRLRVTLLGGVSLAVDGQRLAVGGIRESALVARLALDAGAAVATATLVEDVWCGAPPSSGSGALRVQIRRLRTRLSEAGLDHVVTTGGGGYCLAIEPGNVDLHHCHAILDDGLADTTDERRIRLLSSAHALWGARPFAGLEDFPFTRTARATFDRRVLHAGRIYADALLRTGRPEDAVAVLAPLLAEDPYNSQLAAATMEASRVAGRPHDALRLAGEHRLQLRSIGLMPTPEVLQAEQRSLGPDEPTAEIEGFIGREPERRKLRRAFGALLSGESRACLVEGDAGAGKTALLRWAATVAKDDDIDVRVGSADRLYAAEPFHLLESVLSENCEARRLVAQALTSPGRLESAGVIPSESLAWHRHAVTTEIARSIVAELDGPTAFVLDDLHWADVPSLLVFRAIVRGGPAPPVGIVAAGRQSGRERWTDYVPAESRDRLILRTLGPEDTAALVANVVGGEPHPSLLKALARADGLPFLIVELLRAMQAEGWLVDLDGKIGVTKTSVPVSVRSMVESRLADVGPMLRSVIEHAAILGGSCQVDLLATFIGLTSEELILRLSQPDLDSVLAGHGNTVQFRHELVRDAVEHSVPGPRRAELHRRAAGLLSSLGAPATSVAAHAALAVTDDDDPQLAEWLHLAADVTASLEPTASIAFLDRALDVTRNDPTARYQIQQARAEALLAAGRPADAAELLQTIRHAYPARAPEVALRIGGLALVTDQAGKGLAEVRTALDASTEPRMRSRLLAMSSMLSLALMDPATAAIDAAEADRVATAADDPVARSVATGIRGRLRSLAADPKEGCRLTRLSVELADLDPSGEAHRYQPWLFRGLSSLDVDDHADVELALRVGPEMARKLHARWCDPAYTALATSLAYRRGRLDEAAAGAASILQRDEAVTDGPADGWSHAFLSLVAARRDDLVTARVEADLATEAYERGGSSLGVDFIVLSRARVHEIKGDPAAAAAILREGWDMFLALGVRACLPLLAAPLARAAVATGERAFAEGVHDESRALADGTGVPAHRALEKRIDGILRCDASLLMEACRLYEGTERRLEFADCRSELETVASREGS